MRKLLFIPLLFAALSCTRDIVPERPGTVPVCFSVGFTKTSADLSGIVSWTKGEQISVWYLDSTGTPVTFTATAQSSGAMVQFAGEMPAGDNPSSFWACHPASAGKLDADGKFSLSVGPSKDGTFSTANISAAFTPASTKSFWFRNACAIIRIKLPEGGALIHDGIRSNITAVRVKGRDVSIASRGTVQVYNDGNSVSGFSDPTSTTANAYTTVSAAARSDGYAYIPSLPGTLSDGFCIRYYCGSRPVPGVLVSKPLAIRRSHIIPIADASGAIVWDYYVSPDGTGDGLSKSSPIALNRLSQQIPAFASSAMWATSVRNGATVHLTPGTYTDAIPSPSGSEAFSITWLGSNEGPSVFTTSGSAYIQGATNHTATLRNISFNGCGSDAIALNAGSLRLVGCNFTGGSGAGLRIASTASGSAYLTHCKFIGNATSGSGGGGIHCEDNSGSLALNACLLYSNTPSQLRAGSKSVLLLESTFIGTSSQTPVTGGATAPGGGIFAGCIILGSSAYSLNSLDTGHSWLSSGYSIYGNCYTGGGLSGQYGAAETDNSFSIDSYTTPTEDNDWLWTWVKPKGVQFPPLSAVRSAASAASQDFTDWLETTDLGGVNALETDLYGNARPNLSCMPGCWQGDGDVEEVSVENLKVMTFNILRADLGDTEARKWPARKDAVLAMLAAQQPSVAGMQECTWTQRNDILSSDSRLSAVGVSVFGDSSGYSDVSSNTIFYRSDIIALENWGTFWLSADPDVAGSYTWGNNKPRTCTWARLRIKTSGVRFYFFNTHLENAGSEPEACRTKSIALILQRIAAINPTGLPLVLTGDMNSTKDASCLSAAVGALTLVTTGTSRTFHSYNFWGGSAIDQIFCSAFTPVSYTVVRTQYSGVTFLSDHYPVTAILGIPDATPESDSSADTEAIDEDEHKW